ncbi:MAG TPA: hypothetical protein VGV57_12835 [Thermoleophilaceae bacterium]|nr:hypothetical protein [Thermoleophilaceae bacterium]
MRDLASLTVDDFAPFVGDLFTIDAGDAGTIELELTEAALHDPAAPAADDSGTRSPFSVEFRGPVDPILAQQICRLESDSLGPLELFIVPIGRDAAGSRYEAVFT